jgi:hypothetical protein
MMLNLEFLSWGNKKGSEDSILGCGNPHIRPPIFLSLTARRTAGSAYRDTDPERGESPDDIMLFSSRRRGRRLPLGPTSDPST